MELTSIFPLLNSISTPNVYVDCFKHNRNLCYECVHVGMCDGQQASNCDYIPTTEYNSILNDQTVKLEAQFQAIVESLKGRIQILYC